MIYADNNATTACLPQVVDAMTNCLREQYGNPSSKHYLAGRNAAAIVDQAHEHVSQFIHAETDEIVFTSGATEALNQAILGVTSRLLASRPRLICARSEHHAVIEPMLHCEKAGADLCWLDITQDGVVNLDQLSSLLSEAPTALVAVMLVNNETGVINDIAAMSEICHQHGALLLCDITAALTKMPLDVKALGCDFAAATAHKINGPKGIGFLYKKRGLAIDPLIFGGGQEQHLRSGTENTPGIIGLDTAISHFIEHATEHRQHLTSLHNSLEEQISTAIPQLIIQGSKQKRCPGCSMLTVPGLPKGLLAQLKQVAASAGSSCSSGTGEASHVLLAMGVDKKDANNSVRISLGHFNTQEEVNEIAKLFIAGVQRLSAS